MIFDEMSIQLNWYKSNGVQIIKVYWLLAIPNQICKLDYGHSYQ